jgi:tripartite-type tricarboxylate transporter receptor subunit TctC
MCRFATLVVALAAAILAAPTASAQDNYPSRPITLIAPFAAGGSVDLVSRILAEGPVSP